MNLSPPLSSSNTGLMASRQLYGRCALRAVTQHNYAGVDLMNKVGVSLVMLRPLTFDPPAGSNRGSLTSNTSVTARKRKIPNGSSVVFFVVNVSGKKDERF